MLQPLDVGCFGPLKSWAHRCNELAARGLFITKDTFISKYLAIRNEAFKPSTIRSAWRRSGLHPFNHNIFNDDNFAPSHNTSNTSHFPGSYPALPPPPAPTTTACDTTYLTSTSSFQCYYVTRDHSTPHGATTYTFNTRWQQFDQVLTAESVPL